VARSDELEHLVAADPVGGGKSWHTDHLSLSGRVESAQG
jgi:hypothetical protein